ncbi:MAG: UDP-galactopyranose mutase [Pseudomonadota bacterium]
MTQPIWIAGAGLSGAVVARTVAEAGHRVEVFDGRNHVAGNCHTERDPETGVMLHHYGPHIFHTGDAEVWSYVNRFAEFEPYEHRVWTTVGDRVFAMPINLGTINAFFGTEMNEDEARAFVAAKAEPIENPANFEEQALAMIGPELYEAFFKGYTEKQWGRPARDLPAAVLKRLPLRFNDDTRYFSHPYQGLPRDGYTAMVAAILDHPGIAVHLNQTLAPTDVPDEAHLFWSGPLDAFFGGIHGDLGYRTLDFEHQRQNGTYQSCPVMNYADPAVPYTRITEHKHFAPWETRENTIVTVERSRACGAGDIPYYPIRLAGEKSALVDYVDAAKAERKVTFLGRLGTYRYLDMDVTIREALDCARSYLEVTAQGGTMPAFTIDPLA